MLSNLLALFRKPTPLEVATRELIEAEHAKLQAQSATEYALAIAQYNMTRIERLLKYINESTGGEAK